MKGHNHLTPLMREVVQNQPRHRSKLLYSVTQTKQRDEGKPYTWFKFCSRARERKINNPFRPVGKKR